MTTITITTIVTTQGDIDDDDEHVSCKKDKERVGTVSFDAMMDKFVAFWRVLSTVILLTKPYCNISFLYFQMLTIT
ncbi:unnamed protein product [Brugia pahangi]|uniref:Transmembrane protein n=1 Tax=Brugia pahangi TaxID=6280 RepID=A0A0N4T1Q8_BRUPA|nr:unnamed protein product [Brugia pahangi]